MNTYRGPAVFAGVEGRGTVSFEDISKEGAACYLFRICGELYRLALRKTEGYQLQNQLMEGYAYSITAEDGTITEILPLYDNSATTDALLRGIPGLATLKNFLKTAFMPMGKVLYVFGGGWNWQDSGPGLPARTIGLTQSWLDFSEVHKTGYQYRDESDPAHSYYPEGGWNEFHYAGLDCSAFIGWTLYNTLNTVSGGSTCPGPSYGMAKKLAEDYGYGTWTERPLGGRLQPGDIVSCPGHVWLSLGCCEDGSILVLHSSVTPDADGLHSGGVQLSAVNPDNDSPECEAFRLADTCTRVLYPDWYNRHPVVMKPSAQYVKFEKDGKVGFFRWFMNGDPGLTDPDGFVRLSPREILNTLFNISL